MSKTEIITRLVKEDKITLEEAIILYQDSYILNTPVYQPYYYPGTYCGVSLKLGGCSCNITGNKKD